MNYPASYRTILGLIIGALLFFAAQKLFAQSEAPLLRVRIEAENVFDLSAELEAAGYDVVSESPKDFTIDVVVSEAELEALQPLGLRIIEIERGQPLRDILPIDDGSSDLRTGYLNLAGINARMREVAAAFPDIAQVVNLTETYNAPPTAEGRSLFAVKISDNVNVEEDEPAVMIVSNHHAREVVTPVIALDAIDRLTQGYGTDQQITDAVNNNEIWIAPTWNPDGYNHVVVADNLWRKNRRVFSRGIGVDQNRNYPQGWSTSCSGSTNPSSNTFKGDAPASEAETQTMIAWSRDQRFAKVIDYHSRGREVLYGYDCSEHPFNNFLRSQATALSRASSYTAPPRSPSADGEHYQWQLAQMGAWSYLIETAQEFQPSFNSAKQESDRVWPGILFALENPISLSGHVTDAQTGGPLEATIEFLNVNFRSNETYGSGGPFGRYHASLPPRTYQIRFSASGYQSQERSVTIDSNNSAEVLDIQLQREGSALPSVSVTASDAAAAEAGLDPGAFSITRNGGDINTALTVQYNIAGSATAGSDYQTLSGSATIAAGQSTIIVTVTPIDDSEAENDESVVLSLPPNAGYTVDTPSIATVVIASDDEVEPFGADLVVAAFTGTPTSLNTGGLLNYSVQVLNQGNSPARANFVRLVLSTDSVIDGNDRRLTRPSLRVAALLGGVASATLTGQLTLPADVAPGNYFLGAIVDPSDRVTENNETNNTSTVPITVTAVTGTSPDLVVSLSTTSNSVIPGAGLNYAVAALNQGTAQAGNNFVRLVLSRDATIDLSDLRLTRPSLRVPALAPGTSYPDSGTVPIPANTVPGTYFLGAIVDPSSRVNEANEGNNASNGVEITVTSTVPIPAR